MKKLFAVAGLLALALGLTFALAPTIKASTPGLGLKTVSARSELQLTAAPVVDTCIGDDGVTYTLTSLKAEGLITGSDTRLNGLMKVDAKLLHRPDGSGISTDNFDIVDPANGHLLVRGLARAIDSAGASGLPLKGFVTARLVDGSHFWTHSTVFLPNGPGVPLVIEYGMAQPDVQDLGEIIEGAGNCLTAFDLN
jgi:hypothetical protein